MVHPSLERMGALKRRWQPFCSRNCNEQRVRGGRRRYANGRMAAAMCYVYHQQPNWHVHVNDAVVEPHSNIAAVRAEFDDRSVKLPGGMLGLKYEILHSTAGIHSRFPATEAAAAVSNGEPVVAAVQIKAHDRLQDVFAEYTCTGRVTGPCR